MILSTKSGEGVNKVSDFVDKIQSRGRKLSTKFFNVDKNVDGFIPHGGRVFGILSTCNILSKEKIKIKGNCVPIRAYSLNLEIMKKIQNQCCFVYRRKKLCGFTRRRKKGLP